MPVEGIRDASRRMVRELGFLKPTLAGTALSASAVHAIVEIGRGHSMDAKALGVLLLLEKSTVSRLLAGLCAQGLVQQSVDERDGRRRLLLLTDEGRKMQSKINAFASDQVERALTLMGPLEGEQVSRGLAAYAAALARLREERLDPAPTNHREAAVREGYVPGLTARIIEMHGNYYSIAHGFDHVFEARVAEGLGGFLPRLSSARNGIWHASLNGRIVGSVAIDGEDLDDAAHLRWFITDDLARGTGVGRKLLSEALLFCDRSGFARTRLWTFRGLDAARHLYEANGFTLIDEFEGRQWGRPMREQIFERERPEGA
ncbi:MAG: MarR family transcriptional regulator [Rhodobiaceae bacterium]|nr:MarR family transcriptional regulator [Rhodobiaceae bacterium]MCC0054887.1 MarR family transcriptional regulator [Rhodobiaceae bacterium]